MRDTTGSLRPALPVRRWKNLQKQPPSYLFEELEARLREAPVVFNLVLQLAGDGDPTDDPTAPWPDDRPRVYA